MQSIGLLPMHVRVQIQFILNLLHAHARLPGRLYHVQMHVGQHMYICCHLGFIDDQLLGYNDQLIQPTARIKRRLHWLRDFVWRSTSDYLKICKDAWRPAGNYFGLARSVRQFTGDYFGFQHSLADSPMTSSALRKRSTIRQ